MSDNNFITSSFELLSSIQSEISDIFSRLLDLTKQVKSEREKHISQLPYHINVIDELHINENAHSRILAKILQFRDNNGNYEILESFVEYIKRKKGTQDFDRIKIVSPIITQEKERVDLWIRDKAAKCALIFENKIYDATDQDSQLYRYIEATKEHGFKSEEIFVFYLTKFGDEPSNQTWGNSDTKQFFASRYMQLSFRDDILEWLKQSIIPNIRQKDSYLLSAVSQYSDYLEGLFSLREINKSLNMNLQKIISDKLGLDRCGENEALIKIQETIKNFQDVLNQLNSMQSDILNKQKLERRTDWEERLSQATPQVYSLSEELGLTANIVLNENDSGFHVSFKKEDWELSIVIERYDNNSIFIYIGKGGEQNVDEQFLNSGILIFKEKTEHRNHPYGWEWVSKYHNNPEVLIKDIQSGAFKEFLNDEVTKILKDISDNNIKMRMD